MTQGRSSPEEYRWGIVTRSGVHCDRHEPPDGAMIEYHVADVLNAGSRLTGGRRCVILQSHQPGLLSGDSTSFMSQRWSTSHALRKTLTFHSICAVVSLEGHAEVLDVVCLVISSGRSTNREQ